MTIYTLNVGQGQFVIVTGKTDAVIIDTYVPLNTQQETTNVKSSLATALNGKTLTGLMVTGFDADHFNEVGLKIILHKYRPNWLMYPKYFKRTDAAEACFKIIEEHHKASPLVKKPIILSDIKQRYYQTLCDDFAFEVFSPHPEDMDSSNNCSLVCAIHEQASGARYLVTGDTENARWDSIVNFFGSRIRSTVLAAPHHGSRNGITEAALAQIKPHTVLISAGDGNSYGHPHKEAVALYHKHAKNTFITAQQKGRSLQTVATDTTATTTLFITK